jgi:hypothetical protein
MNTNPNPRRSLPPGDGDDLHFWLGMGAGGRLIPSYQLPKLNPYPHRRYNGMSRLDMGSSRPRRAQACATSLM